MNDVNFSHSKGFSSRYNAVVPGCQVRHSMCSARGWGGGGDKVSMLAHTHPHKPLKKNKVTICNRQADSLLHVWPDV